MRLLRAYISKDDISYPAGSDFQILTVILQVPQVRGLVFKLVQTPEQQFGAIAAGH